MIAETDVQLFVPNVLYLDEKPPKIFKENEKQQHPTKKQTKKMMAKRKKSVVAAKKKERFPKSATAGGKVRKPKQLQSPSISEVKEEELEGGEIIEMAGDDPLFMPPLVEIKMETETSGLELIAEDKKPEVMVNYCNNDNSFDTDNKYDSSSSVSANEDDEDIETKLDMKYTENDEDDEYGQSAESDNDNNTDDDDDDDDIDFDEEEDEPLIMLAKRRGRPRLRRDKESCGRIKAPRTVICRDICKQHCTKKFSDEQRLRLCNYYWSLSKDEQAQYVRKHILARRYTRLKRKKPAIRGSNCVYYLDSGDDGCDDSDLTRVCRKYFEATLCVTGHIIKKALDGYQLEPEHDMIPLWMREEEARQKTANQNKPKEIRQVLDPETGDLVTIDPSAKKKVKSSESAGARKKRVRRKPGDPTPEHFPKPVKCEIRCIFKCHILFSEEQRKQICDSFWALDYKRRKDFVLARIETKEVETQVTPEFRKSNRPPRGFHTRFYLRAGLNGENKRVCKHFMLSTLCISRNFIQNALEFADKTTGYYTGKDRRGHNTAPNKIKPESKQAIVDHIKSYATWVPNKKSKTRYLHYKLSIKQMYDDYKRLSIATEMKFVSSHGYYKSFHEDFRLSFLCNPEPKRGGGFVHLNPNISHYTGEEPGGFWLHPNGEKLDLTTTHRMIDLTKSFILYPSTSTSLEQTSMPPATVTKMENVTAGDDSLCANTDGSPALAASCSAAAAPPPATSLCLNQPLNYAHLMDPSTLAVLNAGGLCPPTAAVFRHDFNPNMYDSSLVQAHRTTASSPSAVFRRL